MAKIGAPANYAAPEEIKKEQLKQSSSQGYQDLAEDVVLGIARAMGAMRPGGPSQAGAGPTAQREITSKSYQMDIARDVAALDAALDAGADLHAALEHDALVLHELDAARHRLLFELHVWDAIH